MIPEGNAKPTLWGKERKKEKRKVGEKKKKTGRLILSEMGLEDKIDYEYDAHQISKAMQTGPSSSQLMTEILW